MNAKHCPKCNTAKPLTEQDWYQHMTGQWYTTCKLCTQATSRAHYAKIKRGEHQPNQGEPVLDMARINALARANLERDKRIVREFRAELDAGVYADVPAGDIIREFKAELKAGMYDE